MIDPIISLSFSLYSNKGTYALLLGSGVSRSAGILTGWEIVLDLICKLAKLEEENCGTNPAKWFEEKYGTSPDYSELLDMIAKTPTERNQLLKDYFEPTEEEREQGLKVPTNAHKAIAELVSKGYVKVIITTNFDRLIEKSLENKGVNPIVISTPDSIEGAIPLVHADCYVIKVHGDYLDTRIKNTPSELEKYDDRLNNLLDNIFDKFGLIICGWSGEWDLALKDAIMRCKNHRFTTYWTTLSEPGEEAKQIINHRRGKVIQIEGADSFFSKLKEKVLSFEEINSHHPLSTKVAIATLKRYLSEEKYKIKLHDLVIDETKALVSKCSDENFSVQENYSIETLVNRVEGYELNTEVLLSLFINGFYWGNESYKRIWNKSLGTVINMAEEKQRSGLDIWIKLNKYPALLLVYGAGIASIASQNFKMLYALLTELTETTGKYSDLPLMFTYVKDYVLEKDYAQKLPGMERHHTPMSDRIHDFLRDFFKDILPRDNIYDEYFDRCEYILALIYADLREKSDIPRFWAPIGRFSWKRERPENKIVNIIEKEADKYEDDWEVLKAGFFDGSYDRFKNIHQKYKDFLKSIHWVMV